MTILMKVFYSFLILLQIGVIIYFVRRGRKKTLANGSIPSDDSYEGLRRLAMSVKPEQLKLKIPDTETFVYGVIMDWNTGDSMVTLATYITGAANLYLRSGGGVKGGGKNQNVGEAAAKFVANAQDYIGSALPAGVTEIPAPGCVRFYLLTNKQMYVAQEQVKHFDDGSSSWLPLFKQGNEVITEMMH